MSWFISDLVKSYSKPQFWIATPNKRILARLIELDETATFDFKFTEVSELQGSIPFYIERNHKTVKNPHFDLIKNKMLIKMKFMDEIMWFVINDTNSKADNGETITFSAFSYEFSLTNKKLYEMEIETSKPTVAMEKVLEETLWRLEHVGAKLSDKYRSFEFSTGTTVLDALYEMAESYGGILRFDTINRTIRLEHEDDICTFDGLMINDSNYIDTIEDTRDGSEITTRLYAIGNEGMTFNTVSPTGQSYVEDFSYFMYPFERDENKKVMKSSFYMSDELCHALLNYKESTEIWSPSISQKFNELKLLQEELSPFENSLSDAQLQFDITNNTLDILRANQEYYYHKTSDSISEDVRTGYYFVQARMINSTSGSMSISANTSQSTPLYDGWTTLKLDNYHIEDDTSKVNVSFSGGTVEYYMIRVSESDYNNFSTFSTGDDDKITPQDISKKYNIMYHEDLVHLAQNGLLGKDNIIKTKMLELQSLKENLNEDKFFTTELKIEKDLYVFSDFFVDDTHIDEKEMYDDTKKKISELRAPSIHMNLDIHNFLNSIEEKRNWERLKIGKKVRVKHNKLDIYSEALLTGISFDFGSDGINLTITGTKDIKDPDKDLTKMLYDFAGTSSMLALKKFIYDDAATKANAATDYMNSNLDAAKQRIHAGVNESVEISNRGLVIRNIDYPDEILIATAGVFAISDNGGQTFRLAITAKGITATEIVGQIIISNKAWIQDDNGIVTIKGDLIEIKDAYGQSKVKLGQYEDGKYGLRIDNGGLEIVGGITEDNISDAFKDGILNTTEIKMIESHIVNLEQIKVEKTTLVSSLINDTYISAAARLALNLAKTNFDTAYVDLISYIRTIIADSKITELEKETYLKRNDTFNTTLEALIIKIQEAEKSIETNNIDYYNSKLRTDLRLTAPLPTSISLDSSGITAYTTYDTSKLAKMDHRGIYVQGGAIDIRTDGSSTSRGVTISADGIKGYDSSGNLKFSLSSATGRMTATDGIFSGELKAATGTFSGSLSAATGTFSGSLNAASGTFTGSLNGNYISGATIYGGSISGNTISGGSISGTTITGGSISGTLFTSTGYSSGYYMTTRIDGTGFEYVNSSYGGIKLQYAVLGDSSAAFLMTPTNGSSSGALALRGVQLQVEDRYGSLSLVATSSQVAVGTQFACSGKAIFNNGLETGNVYIGYASIGVGGTFDDRHNPYNTSLGARNIYLPGTVYSGGTSLTSSRDRKKNIVPYAENALGHINKTQIYQYHLNEEFDNELKHLGIILQEAPIDVIDPEGGVELYAMTSMTWKAIQELSQKNIELENKIAALEKSV